MPAAIDDQPWAERFTSDAAAGAARHERDLVLARVAHQRLYVRLIARHDDAERANLKDAGIRAVKRARKVIEEKLSLEESLQVVADIVTLRFVHGRPPRKG